jgi:hypothetical protein
VITPSAYKDSFKGAKSLGSILTLSNFLSCSVLTRQGLGYLQFCHGINEVVVCEVEAGPTDSFVEIYWNDI